MPIKNPHHHFVRKAMAVPKKTWCDTEMHKLLRILLAKGKNERPNFHREKNPKKNEQQQQRRQTKHKAFMLWQIRMHCIYILIYNCELDLQLLFRCEISCLILCACVLFCLISHIPPRSPDDQNELITHLFHTEWFLFVFLLRFRFVWAYL